MLRRLIGVSLLAAAFVGLPKLSEAQAPKKPATTTAPPADSSKMHAGTFIGKLKSTINTDRTFTVTIENKKLQPTGKLPPGYKANSQVNRLLHAQTQALQAQQRLATARTAHQMSQAQQQLIRAQLQAQQAAVGLSGTAGAVGPDGAPLGYKWVVTTQDIDFQAMEDMKVRTVLLPEQFDDKGNIKKYTKDELAELKGKDKNLKGYESSQDKLEVGQKVEVHLTAAKKPAAAAADENKDKDVDKDSEKKMQVNLLVILQEAPADSGAKVKPKKKAK